MLPRAHGGTLVDRVMDETRRKKIKGEISDIPSIEISDDIAVDLENIAYGVFSPLEGFMSENDYRLVLDTMRLENDVPWTIPVVLDMNGEEFLKMELRAGDTLLLKRGKTPVALMELEDLFKLDRKEHALKVFRTSDPSHPGVKKTLSMGDLLLGGKIEFMEGIENPFERYTLRPVETRILFKELGWRTVVGFQTRNAPHLGHEYVQKTALTFVDGLFINPVIGRKKKGDFRDEVILKAYEALIDRYYLKEKAVLSILRTEMRYAGPREAVFHAIVRKNFGCTHFIVGRDHAGVGDFYGPYDAQEIFGEFPDLGITPVFFRRFYYCKKCYGYVNEHVCPHEGDDIIPPSGTKIREMLASGKIPPREMMRPEVAEIILGFKNPFVE